MMASRVFTRTLASATKSTKPPIQIFGLDGTYANALYSASASQTSVEQSFAGLTKIKELLDNDARVKEIMLNPALTKDARNATVLVISEQLKLDNTVTNFLLVLAENNRLANFKGIYEKYGLLNDAYQGVVEAKVTSAKALDSKILRRLQAAISKSHFVGDGKSLKLTNTIDPEILGGLVVEVGDRTVDLSIQSKVSKLNQTLNEAL